MNIMLQNSTEETKVVFELWMMVIFPAISPFPSSPGPGGCQAAKAMDLGLCRALGAGRDSLKGNDLASPGYTHVPRDCLLS